MAVCKGDERFGVERIVGDAGRAVPRGFGVRAKLGRRWAMNGGPGVDYLWTPETGSQ